MRGLWGEEGEGGKWIMESLVRERGVNGEGLEKGGDGGDMEEVGGVWEKMIGVFRVIGGREVVGEVKIVEGLGGSGFRGGEREGGVGWVGVMEEIMGLERGGD